jgi:hypothetical protein
MIGTIHRLCFAAGLAFALSLASASAGAQENVKYAWVQWAVDGRPHVRAIVSGPCPALTQGGRSVPMHARVQPEPDFPNAVCDAPYGEATGRVGSLALPAIPRAPTRIAVFGDTGCRVQGNNLQACNDTARWPMPTIVRAMVAAHPQLVIHVGDYYYRESPCPATSPVDCRNTPYGDRWASWDADWFAPAQPLFATVPLVLVRGNHEDCKRGPVGWARYLSALPGVICSQHEVPIFARFDNLLLGGVDSAYGDEYDAQGALFVGDEQLVDSRASALGLETWLVTHKPPMAYLGAHANAETGGAHLAAILSGHIHTFGAYNFAGEPPQLIVGTGGDRLASANEIQFLGGFGGVTDASFGFAIFERGGEGWDVTVYGTDGAVRHRCRLAARQVRCG